MSSSGPRVRATGTPVPKKPWYWPTWCAGARTKLICHEPADCCISAMTCSTAPTTSAVPAAQAEPAADEAKAAHEASMIGHERRTARAAVRSPLTPAAILTWNAITPRVLRTNSTETTQLGASVRETIHSGTVRLSSGSAAVVPR
ncbi:hypothetical protein [Streptomyces caniferus]|uniref:hypothetical protein n=1 Tax=Streptomyces caniferus TaxID=285557 RepID=UPI0037F8B460